ncbi:RDD family protein [Legionella londiniensis]|uniref:RDD family protein n=1 Tax=Legionella londiniensis TaxID=45068 RepID=A0A0W0VSD6_9GAMM|nr:RDD family protein [Legionella londiniensis]KTD23035.1 RDD family protein [Legionella londiniensis]STX94052.1 RDD family [Legionella londiniensis]
MDNRKSRFILFYYYGAVLYDALILCALFFVITGFCLILRHGATILPGTRWFQILLSGAAYLYYALSYRHGGQTIGMRAWGLKLIPHAAPISQKQILKRILLAVPVLVLGLGTLKNPLELLNKYTKCDVVIL